MYIIHVYYTVVLISWRSMADQNEGQFTVCITKISSRRIFCRTRSPEPVMEVMQQQQISPEEEEEEELLLSSIEQRTNKRCSSCLCNEICCSFKTEISCMYCIHNHALDLEFRVIIKDVRKDGVGQMLTPADSGVKDLVGVRKLVRFLVCFADALHGLGLLC